MSSISNRTLNSAGILKYNKINNSQADSGCLIFQGGIPEVEEFIKKFHK